MERRIVDIDDGHNATVFQSFHPSCAVQNACYGPEFRALLIHHFIAVFGELHGHSELPACAEELRLLCNVKGNRIKEPFRKSYMAARYTSHALLERYNDPYKSYPVEIIDLGRVDQLEDRARAFSNMYQWLRRLAEGDCNPGALALGRTRFFNWKKFFANDRLFDQVNWLLRTRAMEQAGWIAPKSKTNDVHAPLSLPIGMAGLQPQALNAPDENLVQKRQELMAKIKEIMRAASGRLRDSSITELAESLHVASVLAYYEEFLKGFDTDGYVVGNDNDGLKMDIAFCQQCLEDLERLTARRLVTASEPNEGLKRIMVIRGDRRIRKVAV
ncbi:hypothetical protein CDD83_6341 [Cordyceps sp. RAO-2017]|nr:hypothetical protein CDD83_6341 [Cordyceps sp. RAO-2017]